MPKHLELFSHQIPAIDGLSEGWKAGFKSQMLYGPCGYGKTELAIYMMNLAAERGWRSAMVMDRRLLVDQTSLRMDKYGIDHGVMMAGHWRYHTYKSIQLCSSQTLEAKGALPNIRMLIVDEAHCQRKFITEFIKSNPQIRVIGLSGSPFTKGLANTYQNIVSKITIKDLTETHKKLAPMRVFISKQIDMDGAKSVAGEWSTSEASQRGQLITGDVVSEWVKITHEIYGEPKKTIVYSSDVAHGQQLAERFREAGHNFVSVSYKNDDNDEVLAEFCKSDSSIMGLIATDILTKGFDCPDVYIGISARAFQKSFSSHVQQLGRPARPHDEKEFCIWIDHSGNYLRFKDDWDYLYENGVDELADGKEKPKPEPTGEQKEAAKCHSCGQVWGNTDVCQSCGTVRVRRNTVIEVAGSVHELIPPKPAIDPYNIYQQIAYSMRHTGNQATAKGRTYHMYKALMGKYPPNTWRFDDTPSVPTSNEIAGKIKRELIAYSKRKKSA